MKLSLDSIFILIIIICAVLVGLATFNFFEADLQFLGVAIWVLIPTLIIHSVRKEIKYRRHKKANQKPY